MLQTGVRWPPAIHKTLSSAGGVCGALALEQPATAHAAASSHVVVQRMIFSIMLRQATRPLDYVLGVALPAFEIADPDDPRVAGYRTLKERTVIEGGRFVAESERVVRRLVGSGLEIDSVLLTAARLTTLADALAGPFPVYLAPQGVLDGVAGFHVHRGCLALGRRPPAAAIPAPAREPSSRWRT